jgi:hypothetical protein
MFPGATNRQLSVALGERSLPALVRAISIKAAILRFAQNDSFVRLARKRLLETTATDPEWFT